MIKVILSGINGKIGSLIYKLSNKFDVQIVAGIDKTKNENVNCPIYYDFNNIEEPCDAVIDFSNANAFDGLYNYAKTHNIPLLIGTTGHNKGQIEKLNELKKHIPILLASNVSIGMNAVFEIVKNLSKRLNKSDIYIQETHHKHKTDMPSGTAKTLQSIIESCGKNATITSVRAKEIVGTHTITYFLDGEIVEIKHTALLKEVFAIGALTCVKKLIKMPNGLYNFNDLPI